MSGEPDFWLIGPSLDTPRRPGLAQRSSNSCPRHRFRQCVFRAPMWPKFRLTVVRVHGGHFRRVHVGRMATSNVWNIGLQVEC